MKRREFVGGLIGATILPLAAGAQQNAKVWRIVILDTAPRGLNKANMHALQGRLEELGYREGYNLAIEYRSAAGQNELIPDLVAEITRLKPDLIVVRGSPEVVALKNATSTIPIVMSAVIDPVELGVAASLAHPGGNITGMSSVVSDLEAKRVQHLKEVVPGLRRMAWLGDFGNPAMQKQWTELEGAARSLPIEVVRFDVRSPTDLTSAFEAASVNGYPGVRVGVDGITRPNKALIIKLATKSKLPAIYAAREFVEAGGLMSYAPDYADLYWRAAGLVDRILKSEKPGDLPIERPDKFELVLNLKAAAAVDLAFPPSLLARADEVIE